VSDAATYRDLADAAWSWTLDQVRDDDGPWLPESVDEGEPQSAAAWDRDGLYVGISGTALALAEVVQHRPLTELEQRLADDVVGRLGRQSRATDEPSLYDGLAGIVTALRHLAPGAERDALRRIGELRKPTGWTSHQPGPYQDTVLTDIIGGIAGIVLTVLWAGGAADLLSAGCDTLLDDADETEAAWTGEWFRTPCPGGRTSPTGRRASAPHSRLRVRHWAGPTWSRQPSVVPSISCRSGSSTSTASWCHTPSRPRAGRSSP
jgi:hypothetical protein